MYVCMYVCMCIYIYIYIHTHLNTPPDKETLGSIGPKNTKSGAGDQFMMLDCRATAPRKHMFCFTDTGSAMLVRKLAGYRSKTINTSHTYVFKYAK